MENKRSNIDTDRFKIINKTMDELYSDLSDIYESIADRDIQDAVNSVAKLISKLNKLKTSMRHGE
jgi:hypothetical protein